MGYCDWGFTFDALKTYHDSEWGVPIHDDRVMFEHLMMEVLQCGLSWSLILKKERFSISALIVLTMTELLPMMRKI